MIVRIRGGCHVVSNIIQPLCDQHWISCEPFGEYDFICNLGEEQHKE